MYFFCSGIERKIKLDYSFFRLDEEKNTWIQYKQEDQPSSQLR